MTPAVYATPLGLHPEMKASTFSVHPGDRLIFYTDGPLEARDRAGRYFQLEDCLDLLRLTDLDVAADQLLDRLLAHAGGRLDDDVAVLLFEAMPAPDRWRTRPPRARHQPGTPCPTTIFWPRPSALEPGGRAHAVSARGLVYSAWAQVGGGRRR